MPGPTNQTEQQVALASRRRLSSSQSGRNDTRNFFWSFSNIFSSNSEPRLAAPPPSFSALHLSITALCSLLHCFFFSASLFPLLIFEKPHWYSAPQVFDTFQTLSLSGRVLSFLSRARSTACYGYSDNLNRVENVPSIEFSLYHICR